MRTSHLLAAGLLAVSLAVAPAAAQDQTPPTQSIADSVRADTALQRRIRDLETQAKELARQASAADSSRRRAQDEMNRAMATLRQSGKVGDSVALLRARVQALEAARESGLAIENASLRIRTSAAMTILDEMIKGVTFISFTQEAIDLEQTEMILTNLWNSKKVRNAWDRVDQWGGVVGATIALLGLSAKSDDEVTGVAAGAGVVGLSRFLGGAFGMGRGDRLSGVVQEIALSKSAFNQLKARNELLQTYVASNAAFKVQVGTLRDSLLLARTRVDTLRHVTMVQIVLDEYALVTAQLPQYIDGVLRSTEGFIASFDNDEQKAALRPILTKAQNLKQRYATDVLPVFTNSNALRTLLEADVARLKANGGAEP